MGRSAIDRSYLSIREVLDLIVDEFPDVTISKIRFLESRGLIHPERTPSGYRKFFETDVERLRWILRQQREHFLPLKVIKGRLEGSVTETPSLFDDLPGASDFAEQPEDSPLLNGATPAQVGMAAPDDEAAAPSEQTQVVEAMSESSPAPESEAATEPAASSASVSEPAASVPSPAPPGSRREKQDAVSAPGAARPAVPEPVGAHFSVAEIAAAAGLEVEIVRELEEYGLVRGRDVAGEHCYDEEALLVAKLAAGFRRFGLESRHLRTFKHAAEREAGLFSQVVTPLLRQRNPAARERAHRDLSELAELGTALVAALVCGELRELTGG